MRNYLSLTIVQKGKVSRQLTAGFKGGYELHKALAGIHRSTASSADTRLDVAVAHTSWRGVGERTLALLTEPDEIIDREHSSSMDVLGKLGLKGLDPERGFVQHIGLGDSYENFTFDQKRIIADYLDDEMPDTLILEPLAICTDEPTSL